MLEFRAERHSSLLWDWLVGKMVLSCLSCAVVEGGGGVERASVAGPSGVRILFPFSHEGNIAEQE